MYKDRAKRPAEQKASPEARLAKVLKGLKSNLVAGGSGGVGLSGVSRRAHDSAGVRPSRKAPAAPSTSKVLKQLESNLKSSFNLAAAGPAASGSPRRRCSPPERLQAGTGAGLAKGGGNPKRDRAAEATSSPRRRSRKPGAPPNPAGPSNELVSSDDEMPLGKLVVALNAGAARAARAVRAAQASEAKRGGASAQPSKAPQGELVLVDNGKPRETIYGQATSFF